MPLGHSAAFANGVKGFTECAVTWPRFLSAVGRLSEASRYTLQSRKAKKASPFRVIARLTMSHLLA